MKAPKDVEASIAEPALDARFGEAEVDGLPDTVKKYFFAAIAPGTPLATTARLRMRGTIKIGRWLPFRAHQVLAPHRGTLWQARVGGVIVGSDRYARGEGGMEWKLAGLVNVMHAEGPDVSRSSAERAAGEAFWIPTSLLPRFGVHWTATDDMHISADIDVDGHPVRIDYLVGDDGRVRSLTLERWGDPDNVGKWELHPFGCQVTAYDTLGGVTIPTAGRAGWFFGTDRWEQGEFFRFRVTELDLVTH